MVLLCIDKETGVLEYWSIGVLEKEIAPYTFGVPVLHYSGIHDSELSSFILQLLQFTRVL
jgi:hypothetical protein